VVEKDNFRLFLPITTMVIISLALTLILWLFKK
jgi:regulatory protein YycH of two-component signal transduction system YycFG